MFYESFLKLNREVERQRERQRFIEKLMDDTVFLYLNDSTVPEPVRGITPDGAIQSFAIKHGLKQFIIYDPDVSSRRLTREEVKFGKTYVVMEI